MANQFRYRAVSWKRAATDTIGLLGWSKSLLIEAGIFVFIFVTAWIVRGKEGAVTDFLFPAAIAVIGSVSFAITLFVIHLLLAPSRIYFEQQQEIVSTKELAAKELDSLRRQSEKDLGTANARVRELENLHIWKPLEEARKNLYSQADGLENADRIFITAKSVTVAMDTTTDKVRNYLCEREVENLKRQSSMTDAVASAISPRADPEIRKRARAGVLRPRIKWLRETADSLRVDQLAPSFAPINATPSPAISAGSDGAAQQKVNHRVVLDDLYHKLMNLSNAWEPQDAKRSEYWRHQVREVCNRIENCLRDGYSAKDAADFLNAPPEETDPEITDEAIGFIPGSIKRQAEVAGKVAFLSEFLSR